MEQTLPRSERLHIAIFGRRNAGKSSIINFLVKQSISIVSSTPGTTADPSRRNIELHPIGPVVLIDTAGLDDVGDLGEMRSSRSRDMMSQVDVAILAISIEDIGDTSLESRWTDELRAHGAQVVFVLTKVDLVDEVRSREAIESLDERFGARFVAVSSEKCVGRDDLLDAVASAAPKCAERETLLGDILSAGAHAILVAPQDKQAPKGRLIMPQAHAIRDLLDIGAHAHVCVTEGLETMLASLASPLDIVITDSQVFARVASVVGPDVPLTSFSILMARYKCDLAPLVRGARKIFELTERDTVLIAEACTHREMDGDIARVKLPAALRKRVGQGLSVEIAAGIEMPRDMERASLVIHCGGCMLTRRQMRARVAQAENVGVPITNFGLAFAALLGILDRAIAPFPEVQG